MRANTLLVFRQYLESMDGGTMLRAAPPCSQGRDVAPGVVYLGTVNSPSSGAIAITAAYTARYATRIVGKKSLGGHSRAG
jgi:hypothetical protein